MELRPNKFKDILGQQDIIAALSISIKSANMRNEPLSHVMLEGGPGLGKTCLSEAIGNELGVETKTVLGGNINSFKDILPTITSMKYREVLFIDEIHRVNKRIAESFYSVLEDFKIDIPIVTGKKSEPELMRIELPRFTIIGATTESGSLERPFLDRFKLRFTLKPYSVNDLCSIIKANIKKLKMKLDGSALIALAKASRGTPRIANGLLEWVRDYRIAHDLESVSEANLGAALKMRGIGLDGSTINDRAYIKFLKKQNGNPVGLSTISSSLGIDEDTIVNIVEPYLLQRGLVQKTSKGRVLV